MTVERVASGVTSCNVYRVGDLLVDVGTDATALPPADRVLLTHCHADHVAALGDHVADTDATVHCHAAAQRFAMERRAGLEDAIAAHGGDAAATIAAIADATAVADGDAFSPGTGDVTVLHTPGHSPGGVSLAVERDGRTAVCCGDVVDGGGRPGRTDIDGGDGEALDASLARLRDIAPAALHPGHGDAVTEAVDDTLALARKLV